MVTHMFLGVPFMEVCVFFSTYPTNSPLCVVSNVPNAIALAVNRMLNVCPLSSFAAGVQNLAAAGSLDELTA